MNHHQQTGETVEQAAELILSEWLADFSDQTEVGFVSRAVLPQLKELARLRALVNSPQTSDFLESVRVEAAHQVERWPSEHDAGKSDADWFWLIGYLAGKAIRPDATPEKKLHHIITTAAACLNWHRHTTGENTSMRPGIEPPKVP